jgi:chorismate mutase
MDDRILHLRKTIDKIDQQIIRLLKDRMIAAKKVGELKKELQIPIEDQSREREILQRLAEYAGNSITDEQLIRIFKAVFKSSKQVQK